MYALQYICVYPQARDLFYLGQYVAMSIVQGCSGFPFLSEGVYKYFTSGEGLGIVVKNEDVVDYTLRFILNKVLYWCMVYFVPVPWVPY